MALLPINYDPANSGLGDTLRQAFIKVMTMFTELYANKVDKIVGKGLSDTNFTQAEKDKLALLDTDDGLQSDWDETDSGSKSFILNKPQNTSDFNNTGEFGLLPFIEEVVDGGYYVRTSGAWMLVSDAFITTSKRYAGSGQAYTLPTGAKAFKCWINDGVQHLRDSGFPSDINTFTQSGDVVTFQKTITAGQRIVIDYTL